MKSLKDTPDSTLKNYVFVNIYIKVGEDDFQLIQYTSYAREKELRELQRQFINQLEGEVYVPSLNGNENKEYRQIQLKNVSHHIINTPNYSFTSC